MSTVSSCALLSSGPVMRPIISASGQLQSCRPAAVAPLSSQRRSRTLSVCCATNPKAKHNPKTDLHPFDISPLVLVNPVPPRGERWQLEEDATNVNLWFQVPGQSKEDLAVEIDEDILVIRKKTKETAPVDGDMIYARLLLPAGYSKQGVEAELKSGVLRVTIAKVKEQARRRINVNIDIK